jgi:two-component system chemotaxis response regulator CheB
MGGVAALRVLLAGLPVNLPAAVVVVQHLSPHVRSRMHEVLGESTGLRVRLASGAESLHSGCVYVAPPDRHLLVTATGMLQLSDTAPIAFVRPAASLLFESAAAHFGARTIAIVLTGRGRDGVVGVTAVKRAGGTVIAQDEATSTAFGMPGAAIDSGHVDLVLPLEHIAPTLVALLGQRLPPEGAAVA